MEGKEVVIVEDKLKKIVQTQGEGELPKKGQEILALYKGTLQDGTVFDSNQDRDSPFTFVLGEGRVIKGWDEGFATMKKGEQATLVCSPQYAYGASGSPPKIPANATLNFEVELLGFRDKAKEKWEYSDEQKLALSTELKTKGNDLLKLGDYASAAASYKEGIDFLEFQHSPEAKQLLNMLRLNISQAYLKLNKNSEVVDNCTKVLKEEDDNLKALYRRALAYTKSQDFLPAKADLKKLLELDPTNAPAKQELINIAQDEKQALAKEKKVFGNIFAKAGLYDDVKTVQAKPQPKYEQPEDMEAEPQETDKKEE